MKMFVYSIPDETRPKAKPCKTMGLLALLVSVDNGLHAPPSVSVDNKTMAYSHLLVSLWIMAYSHVLVSPWIIQSQWLTQWGAFKSRPVLCIFVHVMV